MKEWKLNLFMGCSNNCRYCYGRHLALIQEKIKTESDWSKPVPCFEAMRKLGEDICEFVIEDSDNLDEIFGKEIGKVIFPTKHGITPITFKVYMDTLVKILQMGQNIYITTKANFKLIKKLCDETEQWADKIEILFTIGSMNDDTLKYWEANAPNFKSRLDSLKYAFEKGFTTSVSMQPYLDDPIPVIKEVVPYCNGMIAIGDFLPYASNGHDSINYKKPNMDSILERIQNLPNIKIKDLRIDNKEIEHPDMAKVYTAIKFKTEVL